MSYLVRLNVVPPGGWKYTQPETALLITDADYGALKSSVVAHRTANNLPIGADIDGEIQTQICYGLSFEWCDDSLPAPVTPPQPDNDDDDADDDDEDDLRLEDYGAAIDGVTNDAAAWANALADAKLRKRSIRWMGTSRITSELAWPDIGSNMGLKGFGMGQSILLCDFGGDPLTVCGIKVEPTGTTSNILFKDFTIQGAADNNTAIYELVRFGDRLYDVRFEGVEFAYARHAGLRISTSGNPGARIRGVNCVFRDIIDSNMALTDGAAILSTGYSDVEFIGNKFRNCGNGNFSHAIYTQQAIGLKIDGNDFEGANCRLHLTGTANTNVQVSRNTFRGQVRNFVSGTGVLVFGNNFFETNLRLNDINGVRIIGNYFTTLVARDLIDTIGTPSNVSIIDNEFEYTGAVRTSFSNGFCTDLATSDLLIEGNRCRNIKLCRINAAVRPVVKDNTIHADNVDAAVGFIDFNSSASIDSAVVLRNVFSFITPVGTPRAIEFVGMALGTIICDDNKLGVGSVVGAVNTGWSVVNSKLSFAYSNAGVATYVKLSMDGSDTSLLHDTTPP